MIRSSLQAVARMLVLVSLVGCDDIFGIGLPDGSENLEPIPAEYEWWWAMVEECSGLRGSLHNVRWLSYPGEDLVPSATGEGGVYYPRSHAIVLSEGLELQGHLVRHEMLHALHRGQGHPRSLFFERCSGVVSCGGDCLEEGKSAAPTWDLSAPLARAGAVNLVAQVVPDTIRLHEQTRGCFTVVASLINSGGGTVRAEMGAGAISWSIAGQSGLGGGGPLIWDEFAVIPSGDRWNYIFECRVPFTQPGQYSVRVRYRNTLSGWVTVEVIP